MEKEFDFKNIGKRMPYRTPDGFFGKMQKQVLERTQAERFNRQRISEKQKERYESCWRN